MQVKCKPTNTKNRSKVRVKIIKAPIVNSLELERIIFSRARAIVL